MESRFRWRNRRLVEIAIVSFLCLPSSAVSSASGDGIPTPLSIQSWSSVVFLLVSEGVFIEEAEA